jgi:hypothetical protein
MDIAKQVQDIKVIMMVLMKFILNSLVLLLCISNINAAPLSDELVVLHNVNTTDMNGILAPIEGSLIFNTDDKEIYERNTTSWNRISSDGSETKIIAGSCMDVTGVGTVADPYVINNMVPGKTQLTAGITCKQLVDTGCTPSDGIYWINPDGGSTINAFQVYCDMNTDGGGWTRLDYAADFTHENHKNGGTGADTSQWWNGTFSLTLSNQQINDIRAASTEGKQTYVGTCDGVIHYLYNGGYAYAFGFRYHNGHETAFEQQTYPSTNINVITDGCKTNNSNSADTIFEINDIRVPVVSVHSRDNGAASELFGSPLTNNPAWLR